MNDPAWNRAVWLSMRGWCAALAAVLGPLRRREPLPPRPMVILAVSSVMGASAAFCRPYDGIGASLALPLWLASAAALTAWGRAHHLRRDRSAAILLLAASFLAAAAWSAARFDLFARDDLAWQLGDVAAPIAVRATVVASPRRTTPPGEPGASGTSASESIVRVRAIGDGRDWQPAEGRARVIVRGEPFELVAGSEVRILGRGLRPAAAANPLEFDPRARARADRCLSILRVDSRDCIELLSPPPWWSAAAAIDRLRINGARALAAGIPAERAPLAAALLLGSRDALPTDSIDDFVVTGTIHVLAISGLHVGLLAVGLFAVFRGLLVPGGWALLAVAAVTGLYALLVGAGTPVVRATVIVWAYCLSAAASRRPSAINSLAWAAIVLLAWRPADVLSAGAQLSFLSTAVLVGVAAATRGQRTADPIERLIERSRSRMERGMRRAWRQTIVTAAAGVAVWLATAPLVAARFHVFSGVSVAANLLIAPLVPVAMTCGFLCLLTAPLSAPLSWLFAAGCDMSLAAIGAVVARAADVPAGHWWVAGPPAWWVTGWYVLMAVGMLVLHRELLVRPRTWAALAAGWMAVGLVGRWGDAATPPGGPGARVVVTAVGHGCGIVVRGPTGRCLLYDAGRLGGGFAARRAVSGVLWSEGIRRVDTLVISHADADHFNGVPGLLDRFAVGELLVSEAFLASDSAGVVEVLAAAACWGVPVRTARAGDSLAVDPLCRVRVLHPAGSPPDAPGRDEEPRAADNAASLVLAVETAGRRVLLTGDLEGEALAAFSASVPGECDVLVAPHHGSPAALPACIIRATRPSLVLVSGRAADGWPAVHHACMAAGEPALVLGTGGQGALAVTLSAGGLEIERFAAGRWRPVRQAEAARGGRVSSQPANSRNSWLATYAASASSTPLVKP